ncbi:recombination mediator RecR [Rhodoligotrophos appendicifer]|uniref:recombination mediator RecR n=1 Tax=Rhodoligotrophos appendicifer TaxID=987056 RepID=UPI00117CF92D|nr:recombination mediator RecR [Rhodoligotrophos appendicifer]
MTRQVVGEEIEGLIHLLAKLPGLGPRSARRVVLHLIKNRARLLDPIATALRKVDEAVRICGNCGNVDTTDPCGICSDPRRDRSILCVVEDVSDLWALERARANSGLYHVLGGVMSAIEGVGPNDLSIDALIRRSAAADVKEVILAVNATVDGQTTAYYIMDRLKGLEVTVSRLAHGVPVGGELDYLDEGTLTAAIKARRAL